LRAGRGLLADAADGFERSAAAPGDVAGREAGVEQHLDLVSFEEREHVPLLASLRASHRHDRRHDGYEYQPDHPAHSFRRGAADFPEGDAAGFPEPSVIQQQERDRSGADISRAAFSEVLAVGAVGRHPAFTYDVPSRLTPRDAGGQTRRGWDTVTLETPSSCRCGGRRGRISVHASLRRRLSRGQSAAREKALFTDTGAS
jgi:hypothetical protein